VIHRRRLTAVLFVASMAATVCAQAPGERPGWIGLGLQYQAGQEGKPGMFYVRHVVPGGPAAIAGVQPQDMILSINGKTPQYKDSLTAMRAWANVRPGDVLRLIVIRAGRRHTMSVTSAVMPDSYYEMWKNNEKRLATSKPGT